MAEASATAAALAGRLERVFAAIQATRMADVPILNPRIAVRAIGFREVGADAIGALITPWFLNLVVVPLEAGALDGAGIGETVHRVLPSGRFPFIVGEEPAFGRFAMCSLFSPVLEFDSQEAAIVAAEAALAEVFNGETSATPSPDRLMDALARGHIRPPVEPATRAPTAQPAAANQPISRRELLTGERRGGPEPAAPPAPTRGEEAAG